MLTVDCYGTHYVWRHEMWSDLRSDVRHAMKIARETENSSDDMTRGLKDRKWEIYSSTLHDSTIRTKDTKFRPRSDSTLANYRESSLVNKLSSFMTAFRILLGSVMLKVSCESKFNGKDGKFPALPSTRESLWFLTIGWPNSERTDFPVLSGSIF